MAYDTQPEARPAPGEHHEELVRIGRAVGVRLRLYDHIADAGLVPHTFWEQTTTRHILACEQRTLEAVDAGEAVPAELVEYRTAIEADMALNTTIVEAAVLAVLQGRPDLAGRLSIVRPPRTKSLESTAAKIGRRDEHGNYKPISDYHGMQIKPLARQDGVVDEVAEQYLMQEAMVYLRDYFGVPELDEAGDPTIDKLGNAASSPDFQGGLQGKLRFVRDNTVVFFEVEGLTQSQYDSFGATHNGYHDPEQRKRHVENFQRILRERNFSTRMLEQGGVIYTPVAAVASDERLFLRLPL